MCHHRLPWQHRVWRVVPAIWFASCSNVRSTTMAKLTMRVAPLAPLNEKELIDHNVYVVAIFISMMTRFRGAPWRTIPLN
jgi:hypothetical protein